MTSWVRTPHRALRGLVGDYVGFQEALDPRLVHHGLPSPAITVVLSLDRPLETGWLATRSTHPYWALAAGLHLRPALVEPRGYQCGIQLTLTPEGCRVLLGVPAGALAGQLVELPELSDELGRIAPERLDAILDWAARFDLVDALLLRAWARSRSGAAGILPELRQVWALASGSTRGRRVAELAAAVGRSPRWLSARFAAEYGVTPQQGLRLCRFDRAVGLAGSGRALAEVAATTGYADQAHLTRDWKELAGLTPRQLLASPYRFLQDEPADQGAGSSA